MRNRLKFRPDSYEYSLLGGLENELAGIHPAGQASRKQDPEHSLSKLASALPVDGDAAAASLALDLVLNEIAERARLSTGATGVAIALTRSGELVCRATTGSAPDMGVRLNPHAGLSGLCLQAKTVQSCDDTEVDSRVDAQACRGLRARSVLVVPIRKKEAVLGLLEAFAADPAHFREHDVATLESFCKQIVNEIDHSVEASRTSKTVASPVAREPADSRIPNVGWRSPDRSTLLLTCAVITVAIVLGWMLGRTDKYPVSAPTLARSSAQPTPRPWNNTTDNRHAENDTQASSIAKVRTVPPQSGIAKAQLKKLETGLSESKNQTPANPSGGLVVSQNGRVLFRENAGALKPTSGDASSPNERSGRIIPAGETTLLSPDAPSDYLIHRVEPQYPELSRQQRVQGPVLLKVLVGKDGSVQQVQVLSGDPKLAAAASSAVVKWQFKPLVRAGQPVEFETQITVDFKLP